MKPISIVFSLFLCLTVVSLRSQSTSFMKDKQVILVRKVGDEILKYLGDSSSTVLPIKELGNDEYQIEFESEFEFVSDSVINIISRTIEDNSSNRKYLVKFLECTSNEILFGYSVGEIDDGSVIPCRGRDQPLNCYLINLTLPIQDQKAELATDSSFFMQPQNLNAIASLLALAIIAYLLFRFYKSKPFEDFGKEIDEAAVPHVSIGKFMFFPDEEVLQIEDETIALTNKEVRILELLVSRPNQVVERDFIQKEVWEDEGVIVGRSLDMFISKLRKKLSGDSNVEIKNVHGKGYKLRF